MHGVVVPAVLACYTVNDVCDWVDGMGLSQYRKKFMHHVVDGRLLLRLSDVLLRTELGIGPLVSEPCEGVHVACVASGVPQYFFPWVTALCTYVCSTCAMYIAFEWKKKEEK